MADRIDDDFGRLLAGFDLETLEQQDDTVYGIWADGRIGYVNPSWLRFAIENGGEEIPERWSLGSDLFSSIPTSLKPFYRHLFERSAYRTRAQSDRPVQHLYECSSPAKFRQFLMMVYALDHGVGFLTVHSLLSERAHDATDRPENAPDESRYRQADGLMNQCIYCRKMQRVDNPLIWDWVPGWVAKMPLKTSHTVCGLCRREYFEKVGVDPSLVP